MRSAPGSRWRWALALFLTVGLTAIATHLIDRRLHLSAVDIKIDWDLWVVLTAIGTVGATIVATWLAARARTTERGAIARVVAAWITDDYTPRTDISAYQRTVRVHLANESNEPVYDIDVCVFLGPPYFPVGPLAAPAQLSTIPPRRELVFDISIPLLAFEETWSPRVEMSFTDPWQKRWWRGIDGELSKIPRRPGRWVRGKPELAELQLGSETVNNPMFIALLFLNSLDNEEFDLEDTKLLLAPEAEGWEDVEWDSFRDGLQGYRPTSMVDYPAPQIARVKLSGDPQYEGMRVEGEPIVLEKSAFMTLTFVADRGWRVFGVGGAVRSEQILFPPGALDVGST